MKIVDATTRAGQRELEALLASRRALPDFATLKQVLPIVERVLRKGESALREYVERFDGPVAHGRGPRSSPSKKIFFSLDSSAKPTRAGGSEAEISSEFRRAFRAARRRIEAYHRRQVPAGFAFTDRLGVSFVERPVPLDSVGVYVPGGRAFYPSSLLMGVVPAQVAGVPRIVVATPPRAWALSPELRWAVRELGVDSVLLAGGAHGVAGLVSVAKVAKIVGPGNRFVAAAKHLVSGLVGVDLPAGPSEVAILASADADPALVAADLLAQAEHDPDAKCLLFTNSGRLAHAVAGEVVAQLKEFEEKISLKVMRAALRRGGRIFILKEISRAAAHASAFAAEHVQVMGRRAEKFAPDLMASAGALFIGSATPTALGDYVAGPNHVLPTGGAARAYSGLSTRDFFRWGRSVSAPAAAGRRLARPAGVLARFEGLVAHAAALGRRVR
ncbi:MAG TPA: histidinol dehydrogenase [Thermoanaerobaculia bacterium]|nr:histidinol dehydrogenase [Thermoanaerobaculia bacterium]